MENVLQESFGTTHMGQALADVIVPTYCLSNNQPYFISKYEYFHMPMWQAARCTSVAPTFFPPATFNNKRFIDGGVFENNPVMCGVMHALKSYHLSDLYVVSLGTGSFIPSFKIFDIASNGISQSYHLKMHGLFAIRNHDKRYQRINIELTKDIPLDDTSGETISDLCSLGRESIEKNREILREICKRIA